MHALLASPVRAAAMRRPAAGAAAVRPRVGFAAPPLRRSAWRAASLVAKASDDSDADVGGQDGELVDQGPPHTVYAAAARAALAALEDGDGSTFGDAVAALESLSAAADDAAASAASSEARAEAAEAELEAAKDRLLRLGADFDNFRKRSAAEKESAAASARAAAVEALIPVADSFDAAKGAVAATTEGETKIAAAYGGLHKQLLDAFAAAGVTPVPGEGAPFDPAVHDAVMREPNDDVPDGTVLQEFRRGYALGDRLVRAAMVKVSFREDGGEATPAAAAAASVDE